MKVFLDDIRNCPRDWVRVTRPSDVILLIKTGKVEIISLDHDLGANQNFQLDEYNPDETGYDVLHWIEQAVVNDGLIPPKILIHTSNPPARKRMEAAVKQIEKLSKE